MSDTASDQAILATILCAIAISTLIVGVCLLLLGAFRWGRLVRFVPFPVIAGFLAGTGLLIMLGSFGVILSAPLTLGLSTTIFELSALMKWVPAVALAAAVWILSQRVESTLALPLVVLAAIALFHILVGLLGLPVDLLVREGWLIAAASANTLWPPLAFADFALVDWTTVAAQAPSIASLAIVSAAALLVTSTGLELADHRDIDLDRELRAAGIANLFSGAGGGVSGFQTLSLSILSNRLGAPFRLVGIFVAAICGIALAFGGPLLAYLPKPLFGSLLLWIGFMLLLEWGVESFRRVKRGEYLIIITIAAVIASIGFLEGVLLGTLLGVGLFVVEYSRIDIVKHTLSGRDYRSSVERSPTLAQTLDEQADRIVTLRLQGYLFFGTAHRLLQRIQAHLDDIDQAALRFLVIDLRAVTGSDASAVATFAKLTRMAQQNSFDVVLADPPAETSRALSEEGLIHNLARPMPIFSDVDRALEWCEDELLREYAEDGHRERNEPLLDLRAYAIGDRESTERLAAYLEPVRFAMGEQLIEQDSPADDLYFVESGQVSAQMNSKQRSDIRLRTMGPGTIVGEISFYLGEPRTASVVADKPVVAWRLTRTALERMQVEAPDLAHRFHHRMAIMLAKRLTDTNRLVRSLAD